jgi:V-type H+-transporting ATPase subunit E
MSAQQAGLSAAEAQAKVSSIEAIIKNEGDAKAAEIEAHGEAEFKAEVLKIVTDQKEKILANFARKKKTVESNYAIAKSTAINKGRLEKVKARQEAVSQISEDCKGQLSKACSDKGFITKLIVQGALMLLEPAVDVRCREKDVQVVESVLADASALYAKQIQTQSGAQKQCKFTVVKGNYIPATSLGGVCLACHEGKITIDNTIDLRLKLVIEQDKPAIRQLLFGNERR